MLPPPEPGYRLVRVNLYLQIPESEPDPEHAAKAYVKSAVRVAGKERFPGRVFTGRALLLHQEPT